MPTQMPSTRPPGGDPRRAARRRARAPRARGGARGVADAGDHRERRLANTSAASSLPPAPRPARSKRGADAAQVARAVVGENARFTASPFVEPAAAPSRAHASRSARPSALNAASATWWSSSPARLDVQREARPGSRSRSSACGSRRRPRGRRRGRRAKASETSACGRRTRSTAAVAARLVHRHGRGAVAARRPRAVRAPRDSASPSAASTSSTVWCSSTSRSPPASSSRSKPPWNASRREQVVEEADAGRDPRAAAAVERERDPQRRLGRRADDERGARRRGAPARRRARRGSGRSRPAGAR